MTVCPYCKKQFVAKTREIELIEGMEDASGKIGKVALVPQLSYISGGRGSYWCVCGDSIWYGNEASHAGDRIIQSLEDLTFRAGSEL